MKDNEATAVYHGGVPDRRDVDVSVNASPVINIVIDCGHRTTNQGPRPDSAPKFHSLEALLSFLDH